MPPSAAAFLTGLEVYVLFPEQTNTLPAGGKLRDGQQIGALREEGRQQRRPSRDLARDQPGVRM